MEQSLFEHLPKLVRAKTQETIEYILQSLWRTRKSGLASAEKAHIQELLELSSQEELDPVVVCLRMLIRRCVHANTSEEEIPKLFTPDFHPELQNILVLLLQKLQREWREDMAKDQPEWPRTSVVYQVKVGPTMPPSPLSQISPVPPIWPRLEENRRRSNHCELGIPVGMPLGNLNPSRLVPQQPLQDDSHVDNSLVYHGVQGFGEPGKITGAFKVSLPRLKAMTWSMENQNSTPANRVAVINLKLQDYTKPSSGEIEIKFQLSRDTLEAMLRSMYYIKDQLSNAAAVQSGPILKKPRQ